MKTCPRCNKHKTDSEFNKSKASLDGLTSYCRDCGKEYRKDWASKNPQRVKALAEKHNSLKRKERHCIRCRCGIPNTPQLLCALCKENAKRKANLKERKRAKQNIDKWTMNRLNELRRRRDRHRKFIFDYKTANPCACGESIPVALDFHHKNPEEKENLISKLVGKSMTALQKEIAKCVVLCANCHRKGHAGQPRSEHAVFFPVVPAQ